MRAWVVRGGDNNRLVDEFVDAGVTGVGYHTVPDGRTVVVLGEVLGDLRVPCRAYGRAIPPSSTRQLVQPPRDREVAIA